MQEEFFHEKKQGLFATEYLDQDKELLSVFIMENDLSLTQLPLIHIHVVYTLHISSTSQTQQP